MGFACRSEKNSDIKLLKHCLPTLSLFRILGKKKTTKGLFRHHKLTQAKEMMEITGKIIFTGGSAPDVLPAPSYLTVKFEDVSLMDAPSVKIGESVVDVTNIYKKGEPLMYIIKCPVPSPLQSDYSVSAVLNVGWKPDGDSWIRKGDYLNDTSHLIPLEVGKDSYRMDIEVIKN